MGKMRIARYGEREVSYDEDTPCLICGEPVIGASMGGTVICGSCDCGRCRYCGTSVFVFKQEVDGGKSKADVLEHMRWHHTHNPEIVEQINTRTRRTLDRLEAERAMRVTSKL